MAAKWTRREFVARSATVGGGLALGGALAELVAACVPGQQQGGGDASGRLEIFSWWTAGGEAEGLDELFKLYKQRYPNVNVVNSAVAGGAGTNAKAVLTTRMQGGKPPDSFQVHAGQELIATWVKADKMEPITSIWSAEGWDGVMPKGLKDIVTQKGEVWSVPVNVHRGNALWWNSKALSDSGLSAPASLDELVAALDRLKSRGMQAPLALGSKGNWQITHMFEDVMVAVGGPDFYRGLWTGKNSLGDNNVKLALGMMTRLFGYVNSDHATLDWDEACRRLVNGTAVFNIMGDWAKGFFTSVNWTPDRDFGAAALPGSKGTYMIVCDTFGLPRGAPDRENAVNWLKVCGSRDGQAAFNPKKGSIPARTDVGKSSFDAVAQRFMDDFKSDQLTPSLAHGSAAPEAFASAVNDEMGQFIQRRDVNATATNLQRLADQFLKS